MPRVLLITFCYPPTQVIGSVRPAGLAKFLPEFGWETVVLTPKVKRTASDPAVIETEYRDVVDAWKARFGLDGKRSVHQQLGLPVSSQPGGGHFYTRILDVAKSVVTYPDETKGWIPFAVEAVEEIAKRGLKIDAIVTTSPPIASHLIGAKARKILGCPWVADFRDLWSQNLSNSYPVLDAIQIGLEKRTLKQADALVTVSEPWAARLQKSHPRKQVFAITNGFDPEHFASVSRQLTEKFTITYAGLLYQGRRDPRLLFEVLRELFDEKIMTPDDVRVRFYGRIESWVTTLLREYHLEDVVGIHGVVTRNEALQRQAESQILLMLGWSDPRETGQHSGKLFEYFGAARPILAIGGSRSVLTDTLRETAAGTHAFSKAEVRTFLMGAYGEFKSRGAVSYYGDEAAIGKYTHFQMARRFAEVLNRVSGPAVSAEGRMVQDETIAVPLAPVAPAGPKTR